jgi:hypothetical protein
MKSPATCRQQADDRPEFPPSTPSEVSSPSASLDPRSHITPARSNPLVTLRPQGFAPSRRLAPRATLRTYFIPLPLLGFPFEALIHEQRRTFSRTPGPSRLPHASLCSATHVSASGVPDTLPAARPQLPGLTRFTTSVPPWAFLSEASCRCDRPAIPRTGRLPSPLVLRCDGVQARHHRWTPGCCIASAQPISLETNMPP